MESANNERAAREALSEDQIEERAALIEERALDELEESVRFLHNSGSLRIQERASTMSRRSLRRSNSSERSSSEETSADDIARILQYLVRSSGQIRVFSSDGWYLDMSDSDDDMNESAAPPKLTHHQPDTKVIDKSEFKTLTLADTGLSQQPEVRSLPALLASRELGGNLHWGRKDRCRIGNQFLPNTYETMDTHRNKAFCGTFSKDGNMFLSACQDCKIRAYHVTDKYFRHFKTIDARNVGWSILDTAFSPDGNHVAYSSWSESIHLCNLHGTDKHEALPVVPDDRRFCIFSLMFSHDGQRIIGGANDGYLYVYDIASQERVTKIYCHDSDVNCVAFADDTSQILFSGGDDGLCKVWDRRTLNESDPRSVGLFAGHKHGLTYIDSRGDARHLITNSKDQCIKLWDMRVFSSSSAAERTLKAVRGTRWDYRWQKVPRQFFKSNKPLAGDTSVMTYRGHWVLQTLIRCHFSPALTTGQRYIYTGCSSGQIVVYDALTGEIVNTLKGHRGCVRDVSWHPYLNEIASASWDGRILRWTYVNLDTDACLEGSDDWNQATSSKKVRRRSMRLAQKRLKEQGYE